MVLTACIPSQAQVNITNVEPAPSTNPYDVATYKEIIIVANQGLTDFTAATFSYNDQNITLEKGIYALLNGAPDNFFLQIKVSYPGMTNYVQDALDAGADSFTVTITGVESNGTMVTGNSTNNDLIEVNNGTISLTYTLGEAPKYLPDDSSWPSIFYNYWEADDPQGVAVLVFDQEVKSVYEASVVMAKVVEGGQAGGDNLDSYMLTPKVDGNTVILDFTGVKRVSDTSTVTVKVTTVTGENGLPANMGEGSVSLFKYLTFENSPAPSNGDPNDPGNGDGDNNDPGNGDPNNPGNGDGDNNDPMDGISTITVDKASVKNIYNLKGEKVNPNNLTPGIYIIDGKKVML